MTKVLSIVVVAAVLVVSSLPGRLLAQSAPAPTLSDQDEARRARRAGEIVPLARIVAEAEAKFGGRLLEVELEHDDDGDDRLVYEIEMLGSDGRVIEASYDARTGAFLTVELEDDDEMEDED